MMDKEYEGVVLFWSALFAGVVIGIMFAPTIYDYIDRYRSARKRFDLWLKEGDELDQAVRGE